MRGNEKTNDFTNLILIDFVLSQIVEKMDGFYCERQIVVGYLYKK
jgi:hypothetical protein